MLPPECFYRKRRASNGRQAWCRQCSAAAVRGHRARKAAQAATVLWEQVLVNASAVNLDIRFVDSADLVPSFGADLSVQVDGRSG